ncbi:MAG: hypothetical protein GSR86_00810 [Desulfurococcales archaeon]|nr:hypothetical protein [Desulfurococcales archaeon]
MYTGGVYHDLLSSIRRSYSNLNTFLSRIESEALADSDTVLRALGNYLRDETMKEFNPIIVTNLGSIVTTIMRKLKASDSRMISLLRKTLTDAIDRYIGEAASLTRRSCESLVGDQARILFIPPGRLAEECIRAWESRGSVSELYILSHIHTRYPKTSIGKLKTVEVLPSSLSMIEDRVDTVIFEAQGVQPEAVIGPPVSLAASAFAKHVNNARVYAVSLGLAVKIAGKRGEAETLRGYTEVFEVWGESVQINPQDVVGMNVLDAIIVDGVLIEAGSGRSQLMVRRAGMKALKEITDRILSQVMVEIK